MTDVAAFNPFELLAYYERRCLAHSVATPEQVDAPSLWRGIGFRVGTRSFVASIDEINELLAPPSLTPVPGTRPWLMGVANVRGNLVPVVDFGRFLFNVRTPSSERTRLLLVRQQNGTVGLLVDEVFGQRLVDEEQRRQAGAEEDPRLTRFVSENVTVGDREYGMLSMTRLVRAPDFRQTAV